jgi:predicted acyl esterase
MTAVAVRVRIAAREIAQHLKSLRVPASAIEHHIYQLKKWRSAHRWPPKKKLSSPYRKNSSARASESSPSIQG